MKTGPVAVIASVLAAAGWALAADPLPVLPAAAPLASPVVSPESGAGPGSQCGEELSASSRLWIRAEYLLWRIEDGHVLAPILRSGVITNAFSPSMPLPFSSVVLGRTDLDYDGFSGARLTGGYWLDPEQALGIEAGGFDLWQRSLTQGVHSDSTGNPAYFRPLFDAYFGNTSFVGIPLSLPGAMSGGLDVSSSSRMWGAEVNLVHGNACRCFPLTLFAGVRYLNLREHLDVVEEQFDPTGALFFNGARDVPGSTVGVFDSFQTHNQFYGGQIGARAECCWYGKCTVEVQGKVALGLNHQVLESGGMSTLNAPGQAPVTVPGGFLAVRSNSGRFERDEFSVVPEVQINAGYRLTPGLRPFIGYDFLYWSNVLRPGQQLARTLDQRQIPTSSFFDPGAPANQPVVLFKHSWDFWAQGLTFGFDWRF